MVLSLTELQDSRETGLGEGGGLRVEHLQFGRGLWSRWLDTWFCSSVERSGLEADMWESWAAAESIGLNERAQGRKKKEMGRDLLTFRKGLQRREEEPVRSPEKEWAEG